MSRLLYPVIKPFNQAWLTTQDNQQLYYQQFGNPDGIAVVYLHGGPGGGCSAHYARYFNPEHYHIILVDQRGCGQSKPSPSIEQNTTTDLIADLELLRTHLAIKQWLIAGGSWGTTLALAYGINHPSKVLGFILRGIFLGTAQEYQWLYSATGAAKFFPEYYQDFIALVPDADSNNSAAIIQSYLQLLTSDNELTRIAAAKAWYLWEARLSSLAACQLSSHTIEDTHQALSMSLISAHYFANNCFLASPLLTQIKAIEHLPAIVLHGRYDMVCQLDNAYQLVQAWPNAKLNILPQAGHSGFEQQTVDGFVKAADTMANFLQQEK